MREAAVFFLICTVFCVAACNFFDPNGDVSGSVFVVTAGAGSYKLGLVKVYFCPEEPAKSAFATLQAEFQKTDSQNYAAAISAENANRDASVAAASAVVKQGKGVDGLKAMNSELDTFLQQADTGADAVEKLEAANGRTVFVHSLSSKPMDKIAALRNFVQAQVSPLPREKELVDDLQKYFDSVRSDGMKAMKTYNDAEAAAKAAVDAQTRAAQKFNRLKSELADFPQTEADHCLEQESTAKVVAETDADGLFKIRLPKKEHFIVIASAQRVVGTETERYWWIVPFGLDGQSTGSITLSNDNELNAKDGSGSKIIDLRSKGVDHQWHRYDKDGNFIN